MVGVHIRDSTAEQHPMQEVTFRVLNLFPKEKIQICATDEGNVKVQIIPRPVPTANPNRFNYNQNSPAPKELGNVSDCESYHFNSQHKM